MLSNTATAVFSEDWDAEEPTAVEAPAPVVTRIVDWNDRTGTWSAFDDATIVRVSRTADASPPTLTELPAVAF
jgi:hypothetical protein